MTPQKMFSDSKLKQDVNAQNDMSTSDERQTKERIYRLLKRLIDDELAIDVKNVKYDTGKPVDTGTGKPPVAEETDIKINRKTTVNEADSTRREKDSVSAAKTEDKSNTAVKTNAETKYEKQTGLSDLQKKLIGIGIFSIAVLVVFIIIKIKK